MDSFSCWHLFFSMCSFGYRTGLRQSIVCLGPCDFLPSQHRRISLFTVGNFFVLTDRMWCPLLIRYSKSVLHWQNIPCFTFIFQAAAQCLLSTFPNGLYSMDLTHASHLREQSLLLRGVVRYSNCYTHILTHLKFLFMRVFWVRLCHTQILPSVLVICLYPVCPSLIW